MKIIGTEQGYTDISIYATRHDAERAVEVFDTMMKFIQEHDGM